MTDFTAFLYLFINTKSNKLVKIKKRKAIKGKKDKESIQMHHINSQLNSRVCADTQAGKKNAEYAATFGANHIAPRGRKDGFQMSQFIRIPQFKRISVNRGIK